MRVTMKDIAQVMGVSVMTVSNAFNRPDQLSPELRRDILTRAEKMGYGGPNASARNLRSGRTNAYGVVFVEGLAYAFNDPFSVIWLAGLSESLERAGANITLLAIPDLPGADPEPIRRASVDGFAGMCASHPLMAVAAQRGLPVVTSDQADPKGSWVAIDDRQAGLDAALHLRRLGHSRITVMMERGSAQAEPRGNRAEHDSAMLASLRDDGVYDTWARTDGILEGLHGLDVELVSANGNSRANGHRAAGLVLDRRERPTAVLCLSDVMALGVLDAMAERALQPGRDVSVMGFDDLPDAAPAGLTTIRQPIHDKGRLVGELLVDQTRRDRQITLAHQLVVRSSTGPVPDR